MSYATHQKDFDRHFAIPTSDWVPLIQSLQEDISLRLPVGGGQILDQAGDLTGGFRVHYKIDRSVGVIRVEPLKTIDPDMLGPQGVCKGGIAVQLKVSMQEKWYKKEPKTRQN